jgi:hypothetical protein
MREVAGMLAVRGYFEAGRFVSPEAAVIPEHRSVIVVVTDERISENSNAKAWRKFLAAIEAEDWGAEENTPEFERASLHRETDI